VRNFSGFYRGLLWICCLTALIPLAGYICMGAFMRYSGDDYCYGAALTGLGFWKMQWDSYLGEMAYNSNRYALTLFSGLSGLGGPGVNAVLPGLVILLWLSGLVYALRAALASLGKPGKVELFLAAVLLVFLTLYQAPELAQVLYWRSGMLPYLAPLVGNAFLAGMVFNQSRTLSIAWLKLAGILGLAWLIGGFSETGAALQGGALGFWLTGIGLARLRRRSTVSPWPGLAALGGTLLAMLMLAMAPGNASRLGDTLRPDFVTLLRISVSSAWSFLTESALNLPLPTVFTVLVAAVWTYRVYSQPSGTEYPPRALPVRDWVWAVIGCGVVCFGLAVCCALPSAYARSAYPEPRAWVTGRFVMVLALAVWGCIGGRFLAQWRAPSFVWVASAAALGILCLYPLRAMQSIMAELPKYQRWAAVWDQRHQAILAAKQNSSLDVHVLEIDHLIPDVGDLSPDPAAWYNVCAAGYYGVNTIWADLPGWDE
jgi:hypothetical protein